MSPSQKRHRKAKQDEPPKPPFPGSVYKIHPDIILSGDAHNAPRRVVAIKQIEGPPPSWIVLGRSTTDHQPGDPESARNDDLGLDKKGWWSKRFKHTIESKYFEGDARCQHQGELSEEERIKIMKHYDDYSN